VRRSVSARRVTVGDSSRFWRNIGRAARPSSTPPRRRRIRRPEHREWPEKPDVVVVAINVRARLID